MNRVSINIVAWNSMRYMPDLLRSIFAQTFTDFSVLVIDNGSDDGVEAFLRATYPQVKLLRNARNLGFTGAHNQGIRYALDHWKGEDATDRFVLVTNPDVILSPDFLEKLMAAAPRHPQAGSLGGKLLRAYGENLADEALTETVRSDRFDSAGLVGSKARVFTDRGEGELDTGQYETEEEVFGISGALVLYRASALEAAKVGEEYFDHDFFAYKEDVDLAWRLRLLGLESWYVPSAVAFHYRGVYAPTKKGLRAMITNRRLQSRRRSFSLRNHPHVLVKNEHIGNAILSAPRVLARELVKFTYVAFFETANLKAYLESVARLPKMWKKRREIRKKRKAKASDIRRWFV